LALPTPKKHSISIARARRNQQRLPSSLLIENVPATNTIASSRQPGAATFPIKASDYPDIWTLETALPSGEQFALSHS
jgi:hypothetical protein